jgi:hypothetical protein
MIFANQNYCYQYIPKNASSLIVNHLKELNWNLIEIDYNEVDIDYYNMIVVLRDPYQRWISGFVEDILDMPDSTLSKKVISVIEEKDTWFLDWFFEINKFNFGFHTSLQVDWVNKTNFTKKTYFRLENKLNFKLHHWLVGEGIANNFLNLNVENSKKNTKLYNQIEAYLFDYKNNHKKNRLLEYLQPDYDLISSTSFY